MSVEAKAFVRRDVEPRPVLASTRRRIWGLLGFLSVIVALVDCRTIVPTARAAGAEDGGACREYLWPRSSECVLKETDETWVKDTAVGVSHAKLRVKCGQRAKVCGVEEVCLCSDAGVSK